jgi:hypothetical protein
VEKEELCWFIKEMEKRVNKGYELVTWNQDSLTEIINKEVAELERAIILNKKRDVVCKAADLANLAMLIANGYRKLLEVEKELNKTDCVHEQF